MILIYSRDTDDFVNHVIDYLDEDFVRIGDRDQIFIDQLRINIQNNTFKINNKYSDSFDIEKLKLIWFNGAVPNTEGNKYENECYSILLNSFLNQKNIVKIGRYINNFEVNKLDAIIEAQKQGLKVPDTLFTSKKNMLVSFYEKHKSKNGIISKRISDTYLYENEEYIHDFTLTFEINSTILKKVPEKFAISLFQEKVIADFEIRVVYIMGSFYSMSIHTFNNSLDYRSNFNTPGNMRMIPFNLPTEIKTSLEIVFKNFNLNYGSVDFIYSCGEYYFLEINPIGQINFLNDACNYHIEDQFLKIFHNET